MTSIESIIEAYFKAWNALTLDETAHALAASCAPDIAYVDPRFTCHGSKETDGGQDGDATREAA